MLELSLVLVPQTHGSSSHGASQRQGCHAVGPVVLPYVPWMTSVFLSHLLPRESKKLGLFAGRDRLSSESQLGAHMPLERGA